ncbi:MAG: flagellar basal-body MS-ring/collar protein FliF [Alphaproteobacteria bacterium]
MTAVAADRTEFDSFLKNMRALGDKRLVFLGALGLAMVLLIVLMAYTVSRPQFSLLYTDLQPEDAASIVAEIERMGVPVRISPDGTRIEVPEPQVSRVRLDLAGRGLPASGTTGYEIFDEQGSLGLTSFMQQVNRVRALEGELARTVQSLEAVKAARVHLVLSERDAFTRERTEPSASVVVRVQRGGALGRAQAQTIRHLVAAAVPGLEVTRVTVLDARGNTVLAEDQGVFQGTGAWSDQASTIEASLTSAIERLLIPRLGANNVRVQAHVDLSMEREVVREQIFDPARTALRSSQVVEETEESRERSSDEATTVEQNLPEADIPIGDAGTNRNDLYRTEETTNYEVSSVARERVREPGEVKRITVAVMVNGSWAPGGDGTPVYTPRTNEELKQIGALVKSAIGFDEARGDRVTIENLEFVNLESALPPVADVPVTEVLSRNIVTLIQWLVLLILSVLILMVGVRPVIARLLEAMPARDEPAAAALDTPSQEARALPQPDSAASQVPQLEAMSDGRAVATASVDMALEQMMELRAVKGEVRASSIRKLGQIVDENPEEMLAIMRSWIHEEAV